MSKWIQNYYYNVYNKFLKTELQQLVKEFEINPNQKKQDLINDLILKTCNINSNEYILNDDMINLDDQSNVYSTIRTVTNLETNYSGSYSGSLLHRERMLREKLYQLDNQIDHQEIKLQINSILDVIKKPNCQAIDQPSNIIPLLFEHQKQNITWMQQLEDQIDQKHTLSINNCWPYFIPLEEEDIVYSCYSLKFIRLYPKQISLSYQGGILADQIGCGKTINCIGLMLEKSREPKNFQSRANLVLCPSHLAQQWFDEIQNNTHGVKTIMIRTKKDWEMINYRDLMTVDIVIVTYQFLGNLFYQSRSKLFNSYDQYYPNLDLIQWHRLFLDEGHEIIYNNKLYDIILNLQSKYKWYVSGTPFIDGSVLDYPDLCVYRIAKFLGIQIYPDEILAPNNIHCIKPNLEFMREITKLMIKNTKESINLQLPKISINDKLLDFHKTEKGRYDMAKSRPRTSRKWLLQLCCSMNLADQDIKEFGVEKTLEQIHEIMIQNQEDKLSKKRKTLEKTIPKKEETIITEERQEIITRLTKEIKEIEKSLKYLKIVLNEISNEQSCPICLEVIQDLAITDCGHVFCSKCIEQSLNINEKCPNCRTITNYMIVSNNNNININKYGTKITELIEYLKQIEEKVIIFSQWDRLLHKVGDILKQEGFPNVFCQGSIFQRNKCLQEFRKKDVQILMMSLEYAVSGTNLTEANNIIILDIFDGTKDDIEKKEAQAIGRIHRLGQKKDITVTRFIIKDTLEEEMYKNLILNINNNGNVDNTNDSSDENTTII